MTGILSMEVGSTIILFARNLCWRKATLLGGGHPTPIKSS